MSPILEQIVERHQRSARAAWLVAVALAVLFVIVASVRSPFPIATMPRQPIGWMTLAVLLGISLGSNSLVLNRVVLERLMARPVILEAYPTERDESVMLRSGSFGVGLQLRHLVSRRDVEKLSVDERPLLHVVHIAMGRGVIRVGLILILGAYPVYSQKDSDPLWFASVGAGWVMLLLLSRPRVRSWTMRAKALTIYREDEELT